METNVAFKYKDVYKELQESAGSNPMLLQSFVLNNNTDIIKSIEYFKSKKTRVNDTEEVEIDNTIARLENLMVQRLLITEDLFAQSMPLRPTGPQQKAEEKKEVKKETKVIDHPASKGKKKPETVNEKVGKEIEDSKKVEKPEVEKTFKSDYDKLHPTEENKIEALNKIIPSLEEKLNEDKEDRALSQLKFHLKSYGEDKKHFATIDQMKSLLHWVKEGKFVHLSPLHILRDQKLSIADIVKEAEKLVKEDGLNQGQLKDYMRYYVIDNALKEYTEDKIIRTKEEYDNFFQKSMAYLFDEVDERNNTNKSESATEKKEETPEDRKLVLSNLYDLHKKFGLKSIIKIAVDFIEYITTQGKTITRKASLTETIEFLKSHDPKMYKDYMDGKTEKEESSRGDKKKISKDEIKEESKETSKTDSPEIENKDIGGGEKVEEEKKELSAIKFPRLEDQLKNRDTKINLTEFLITIVNKHISPIGIRKDGIDKQIEDVTELAKKRILEMGLKKEEDGKSYDDWTEKDVLQYMAEEVIPFITDEYMILASTNDLEFQKNLEIYLQNYPAGKEKERNAKLKEVLAESEVPRTKFASKAARKVRKGNFDELNEIINKITTVELEKAKEEVKDK